MLVILIVTLGLAGLFGFFLGMYFFTYRVSLPEPLQWLSGILGGLFMAIIMSGIALLMIWPPLSLLFLVVGLVFIGTMTAVTLGKKPTETFQSPLLGGEVHAGMDTTHGLDIDAGARS